MTQEKALYDSLLKNVVSVGGRAFAGQGEPDLYLDGTSNMLDQREFEDVDRMRGVFKTFEEKSRLVKILNACLSGAACASSSATRTRIPTLRATAMVTASCPLDGETRLGPRRGGQHAHGVRADDRARRARGRAPSTRP